MLYNIDMSVSLKIIIAFATGFLAAQLAKMIIYLAQNCRHLRARAVWEHLRKSGGMPSGHSASMFAATTYIGLAYGFTSGLFALALCVTAIIIYDATNVRFAVGEQGKVLQVLAKQSHIKQDLKIVEGHTWPQVIVGAIMGILLGLIVFALLGGIA